MSAALALAAERPSSLSSNQLSEANFRRLAELIQSYAGIKMPPSKRTMLEGRLRRRMRASGAPSLDEYCRSLFTDGGLETELVPLIDAVTTNKTEFFREAAHFDFLRDRGLAELARPGDRVLKAWSAACSTGAEPYTMAMVFEEHQLRTRERLDYSILCTDLCTDVLEDAIRGIYPAPMVEPVAPELRQRYLLRSRDPNRREVRISPALRARLSFARLNLMDEAYPVDRDMDLIFCRNILIYFDKPTQQKVLGRLCDHLRPGGYLLLGHSESVTGLDLPVSQVANTVFRRS